MQSYIFIIIIYYLATDSFDSFASTSNACDGSSTLNSSSNRGRNGYNGRHLIGWLTDVQDKFEKIKVYI